MELIDAYADLQTQARKLTKDYSVSVVLVGDNSDADVKEHTTGVITRNPALILRMTKQVLLPLRQMAKYLFVIRGTPAHVGKEGHFEEQLGEALEAERTPDGDYSWWRLETDFFGPKLDIGHKVGRGILAAIRLANQTVLDYTNLKQAVPQYVFRGHQHAFVDTKDIVPACRVITLPCFQGPTDYIAGDKLSPAAPDIGGVIMLIDGPEVQIVPILYPFKKANEVWQPNVKRKSN